MSTAKSDEIKVRVTHDMKAAIVRLASARGEGESVIVREAIKRYLNDLEPLRETPPPYGHAPTKPEPPPHPPAPDTKKSRGLPGFAAALSLAALLLLAVGCVHPDDQRIAKTHQLRVGMTPAEVEKLMGKPRATESMMMGTNTAQPWRGLVWKYYGLRLIFQDPANPTLNAWLTN